MQFEAKTVDGITVLTVSGEVDLQTSPHLREPLQNYSKQRCQALVLNLANTTYMDSSGLATLVEYYQSSRAFDGKLALCHLSPRLKNLFEVARLEQIFSIFPDETTAVAALKK